jgi:hypothetical protein
MHKSIIFDLLSGHKEQLLQFGVKEIGLFGSFVAGKEKEESDIDLLVEIDKKKKTLRNFLALNYYLEELMGRKVELVTKQSLSKHIGPHILKSVEYVHFTD